MTAAQSLESMVKLARVSGNAFHGVWSRLPRCLESKAVNLKSIKTTFQQIRNEHKKAALISESGFLFCE